jgi:hypothetical protein
LSADELSALIASQQSRPENHFPMLESSASLNPDDLECFGEIREVLRRYGKLDRFGIALMHKHFDLNDGESLVETTNIEQRSMLLEPVIIDSSDINTIDTQWYLGNAVPLSVVKCRTSWHS